MKGIKTGSCRFCGNELIAGFVAVAVAVTVTVTVTDSLLEVERQKL